MADAGRKIYRQGDVLVQEVDVLPADLVPAVSDERGRIVLAEGEVTGHAHTLPARDVRVAGRDRDGVLFLGLDDPCLLTHDEHDTITIPRGLYRVVRQREYTPDRVRPVVD